MVSKNATAHNKISIQWYSIFTQCMAFAVDDFVAVATNEIDEWSAHRLASVFDKPFNADPFTIRYAAFVQFVNADESCVMDPGRAGARFQNIDINQWKICQE